MLLHHFMKIFMMWPLHVSNCYVTYSTDFSWLIKSQLDWKNLIPRKFILVSNSIHDGSSSIVAQLAAAQQNQQFHESSKSISSNNISSRSTTPQIHAAKLALASNSVVPSISGNSSMSNAAVMTNSNNILANGVVSATSNGNLIENQMLLRDYVNLPPPPPYPGTSSTSNLAVVSSITNTTPKHGHTTSNVSVGSNGM